ncbi:putative delta(4)-3-oxosteroid 5-beta-reductase [Helianthus annuus]|nr:putative delta(4)-3-oxosteroid 5-beta-reductase [Helianthus annuus]
MEQAKPRQAVALIVGVTAMMGDAIVKALKQPTALGGPWTVYGVSRRSLPTWFPSSLLDKHIMLDTLNQHQTHEILAPLSSQITHVFWLAIQFQETEQVCISLNTTMLSNVLNALTSSPNSKLSHVTLQTGSKHYVGPLFDPILSTQLSPHDSPFIEDYPRLPLPNFYYNVEDILASYSKSFTYSIHRPSIILGVSTRSYFNIPLTLAVYALVCKHQNYPFRYFGNKFSWEHFWDMTNARVIAEQHVWASVTDKAKNEAFNCTNGDVFTWKMMWKLLCDTFDVEFVPFDEKEKFDIVEFMKDKGEVWDKIVEENGLYKTKMEEMACFGALDTILKLEVQHVLSMTKSREFGFHEYANTPKSIKEWAHRLRQMKILP